MKDKKLDELQIQDITEDYTLSIVATLDSKNVELPAEYAHLAKEELEEIWGKYGKNVLPLENIVTSLHEKMLQVSFSGHISKLDLIAISTDGVFRWGNVKIYKIKLSTGKDINLLASKQLIGERFNRRRGVRVDLDKAMKIEQQGEVYTVVVRDLSYCGLSFVEPNGAHVQKGMPFVLNLVETAENGDKEIGKITGKILNQRELEDGAVISGCIISANHATMLQRYIAIKQIEQISGKRNSGTGIKKTATGEDWEMKLAAAFEASIEKE